MTNQTKFVSQEEMKDKIKKYFLEPIEDRFTQVSTIKCKRKITIKLTTKLTIDFRKKGSVGLVFFRFDNENTTDWLGMNRLKLYLIIDSKIRIELNDISGQDFNSSLHKDTSNKHYTKYYETAQLSLPPSDYKIIANANTIEYSLRFDKADYEGYFTKNELNIFKGFYNVAFDDNFQIEEIYHGVTEQVKKETILKFVVAGVIIAFAIFLFKACS